MTELRNGSRFHQDRVWTDASGVDHKIKKMEPGHVKNVIAMLRRRVEDLAFKEYVRESTALAAWQAVGMGEAAEMAVENQMQTMLDHPHRWLENTPLMRELVRVDLRNERRLAKAYRREGVLR